MAGAVKARRRRGYTRVSAKNQVTIPVDVLAAAHLAPGDELRVEVDGSGRISLTRQEDAFEDLQPLRDEWER